MKQRYDRELTSEELLDLPDDQIDLSDIPELDERFWERAKVVRKEPEQRPEDLTRS